MEDFGSPLELQEVLKKVTKTPSRDQLGLPRSPMASPNDSQGIPARSFLKGSPGIPQHAQEVPKSSPRVPKGPQGVPKGPQRVPKGTPRKRIHLQGIPGSRGTQDVPNSPTPKGRWSDNCDLAWQRQRACANRKRNTLGITSSLCNEFPTIVKRYYYHCITPTTLEIWN